MKMPVIQVRDLIASRHFQWIDHLSTTNVEPEFVNDTSKTVVLVTESDFQPGYYANATFKFMQVGCEIQIFYKSKIDFDITSAEIEFQRLFVANGWQVAISREHVYDPDTGQLTKTIYVEKQEPILEKRN